MAGSFGFILPNGKIIRRGFENYNYRTGSHAQLATEHGYGSKSGAPITDAVMDGAVKFTLKPDEVNVEYHHHNEEAKKRAMKIIELNGQGKRVVVGRMDDSQPGGFHPAIEGTDHREVIMRMLTPEPVVAARGLSSIAQARAYRWGGNEGFIHRLILAVLNEVRSRYADKNP